MALILITNPVGSGSSKFFAGFQKCNVVFKREDLAIDSIESGSGGIKINVSTDLTSVLSAGDAIYVYSKGASYTYDGVGIVIGITSGDITVDIPYIQTATGGYINYKKNWYVELQCVDPVLSDANLLPFSLESDGDAAGNVIIDVSIVNELNVRRGEIAEGYETSTVKKFEIKYREVYDGSSNSFTLVDNKLFIMLCCIDVPDEDILNQFDEPQLYLGYPAAIATAIKAHAESSTVEMTYKELDINKAEVSNGTLGSLAADVDGFNIWKWETTQSVQDSTQFIELSISGASGGFDFASPDFDYPDFLTE